MDLLFATQAIGKTEKNRNYFILEDEFHGLSHFNILRFLFVCLFLCCLFITVVKESRQACSPLELNLAAKKLPM